MFLSANRSASLWLLRRENSGRDSQKMCKVTKSRQTICKNSRKKMFVSLRLFAIGDFVVDFHAKLVKRQISDIAGETELIR